MQGAHKGLRLWALEFYLSLLTLHGTLMVFFVLTIAPLNAFGNLVLPEQLGAKSMAFLNLAPFWTTAASVALLIGSFFAIGGDPLSGLFLGQPRIDAYLHDTHFVGSTSI